MAEPSPRIAASPPPKIVMRASKENSIREAPPTTLVRSGTIVTIANVFDVTNEATLDFTEVNHNNGSIERILITNDSSTEESNAEIFKIFEASVAKWNVESFNPSDLVQLDSLTTLLSHFHVILKSIQEHSHLQITSEQKASFLQFTESLDIAKRKILEKVNNYTGETFDDVKNLFYAIGEINEISKLYHSLFGLKGETDIEKEEEDNHESLEENTPRYVCVFCCEVKSEEERAKLACGHTAICKECALHYIVTAIVGGAGSITQLTCPNCTSKFTEEDISTFTPHLLEKYKHYKMLAEVNRDPNSRWCPRVGCGGHGFGASDSPEFPKIECTSCHQPFCFLCNYEWHNGLTCKENEKLLLKQGKIDVKALKWKKKHHTKHCPKCGASIEKNHGCNHMTCSACRHEFCWVCSADYSWDHFSGGKCQLYSRRHRFMKSASEVGGICLFGVYIVVTAAVAVPVVILGSVGYGVYVTGKLVAKKTSRRRRRQSRE